MKFVYIILSILHPIDLINQLKIQKVNSSDIFWVKGSTPDNKTCKNKYNCIGRGMLNALNLSLYLVESKENTTFVFLEEDVRLHPACIENIETTIHHLPDDWVYFVPHTLRPSGSIVKKIPHKFCVGHNCVQNSSYIIRQSVSQCSLHHNPWTSLYIIRTQYLSKIFDMISSLKFGAKPADWTFLESISKFKIPAYTTQSNYCKHSFTRPTQTCWTQHHGKELEHYCKSAFTVHKGR